MSDPKLNFVQCPDQDGGHRMAYWQWGDTSAGRVIVCVHGLTRQGRDFDELAKSLLAHAREPLLIICPDVAGRGTSDWLKNPMGYQIPNYAGDMLALLAQIKPKVLDWVGTSMGGLIGMVISGQSGLPLTAPVRKLVLNDVGPVIQWESIQRISAYVGKNMEFASLEQAADAMWAIASSFGPHTREQWLELSRHMVKPHESGNGVRLHYDPSLALAFGAATRESAQQGEALLWQLYDQIQAETLLIRGADSDLLSKQTALAMTERGPRAKLVEFSGVGHAPTLITPGQIKVVEDFLL